MLTLLAVEGMTLTCTDGGTASVISASFPTVKCEGKKVYLFSIIVSVVGASNGGCNNASGVGAIVGNPTFTKTVGNSILTEGSQGKITVTGTDGMGAPCSFVVTVTVQVAGQTTVKTEME